VATIVEQLNAALIGRYAIERELGAGSMAPFFGVLLVTSSVSGCPRKSSVACGVQFAASLTYARPGQCLNLHESSVLEHAHLRVVRAPDDLGRATGQRARAGIYQVWVHVAGEVAIRIGSPRRGLTPRVRYVCN
jgi:hypothetical protein